MQRNINYKTMATVVSLNVNMPRSDISFIKKLGKRMGWTITEEVHSDSLYDPETGQYLNEKTMQAIRDVEAGKVERCNDLSEVLAKI